MESLKYFFFSETEVAQCALHGFELMSGCKGCVFHGMRCHDGLSLSSDEHESAWGKYISFVHCVKDSKWSPSCNGVRCAQGLGEALAGCIDDKNYMERETRFMPQPVAQFKMSEFTPLQYKAPGNYHLILKIILLRPVSFGCLRGALKELTGCLGCSGKTVQCMADCVSGGLTGCINCFTTALTGDCSPCLMQLLPTIISCLL